MGKARKRVNKEELAEDYCFECKDGGFLVICDYKNCLKSYHPACIGRDNSNPGNDEYLKCGWHSCFICQKNASNFYCYCCPRGVCRQCILVAEFVLVRGAKGFCSNCLKLALLIEENRDVDSDGGTIDFKDRGTMEFLFMEYWVIIKEKEGLSVENLWSADALLKKNQNFESVGDVDVIVSDEENNVHMESDCDDIEEEKPERKRKRSDAQRPQGQVCPTDKRIRTKFIGWGSRQLVEFLISLGKDTSIKLSQSEVTTIINDYICANKLIHPEKKKRVLCDARLISIFGRKSVHKNKIYDHLERHFAENYEQSEDDDMRYHSDKIKNSLVVRKSLGKSNSDRKSQVEKVILDRPKSCFASLAVKNVKLVYLKRSLVEELLKDTDTFEVKVMGAFVRVKSDPNDYTQKNSHQLVQVTGIKKSSKNVEVNADVLLLSSIMPRGVPICMLSDDDFSEAECIDLHGKVKDGLLKRPTVVELEQKAQALHEDITKHWIVRELDLLSKLFARANEKGWRAKRSEYMARKQLLETEAEQSRLLQQAPEVIADFEEVEPAHLPNECLPKDGADNSGMRSIDSAAQVTGFNSNDHLVENEQANSRYAADRDVEGSVADRKHHQYLAGSIPGSEENWHRLETRVHVEQPAMVKKQFSRKSCYDKLMYQKPLAHETIPLNVDEGLEVVIDKQKNVVEVAGVERLRRLLFKSPTGNKKGPTGKKNEVEDVEMLTWRIKSPTGNKKGPYSMALLQRWLASSSTACKYKVWKMGEREEKAIFLPEALCRIFTIS